MGWTSLAHGLLLKVCVYSYPYPRVHLGGVVLKSWDIVAAFYSSGGVGHKN